MDSQSITLLGVSVVLLGFLIVLGGLVYSTVTHSDTVEVKGGGVVFIGPVPIIFGSDSSTAVVVSVMAIVLMIIIVSVARRYS